MFGIAVPQEIVAERGQPARWYGARAIFHPGDKEPIDIVWDRQSVLCQGGLSVTRLTDWLTQKAFAAIKSMPEFRNLTPDSDKIVEFKDGQFTIHVSPASSYGYLYIGAWQYWPKDCMYEQSNPTSGVKWSGKLCIPEIGKRIVATINGEWRGVVTAYFVEHGYQGIEVDCSGRSGRTPEFYKKQHGDPKRVLLFGCDLIEVKAA